MLAFAREELRFLISYFGCLRVFCSLGLTPHTSETMMHDPRDVRILARSDTGARCRQSAARPKPQRVST